MSLPVLLFPDKIVSSYSTTGSLEKEFDYNTLGESLD
jgi:hypothetical protein